MEQGALQTEKVEVKYKDEPRPGGKNWQIKDVSGQAYSVPAALAAIFSIGGTYEVRYQESIYNSKVYRMVKTAKPAAGTTNSGTAPAGGTSAGKDETIFMEVVVGRMIQSGQLNALNLILSN